MLGLTGVDIGLFEDRSHLYPSHVLADPKASSADLVARVTGKGLEIADIFLQTAGFGTMTVNHPDAAERRGSRELFERTLEFVQLCGTSHMTILPGIEFEGSRPTRRWRAPPRSCRGGWNARPAPGSR